MRVKMLGKFLMFCVCAFLMGGVPVHAMEVYRVPSNSSFKSYMDYGTITDRKSKQYKIQAESETDENGLRTYKGYYTVAVGTGFGASVGECIDVQLSTGELLHCVIGDIKKNEHTDSTHMQVAHNGNVVEFIVDMHKLNHVARERGDISYIDGFEGYVKTVSVMGMAASDIVEEEPEPEPVLYEPDWATYLIMSKCELPTPTGDTLYSLEYAFGDTFNSIICTQSFYDSVSVGDVVDSLE